MNICEDPRATLALKWEETFSILRIYSYKCTILHTQTPLMLSLSHQYTLYYCITFKVFLHSKNELPEVRDLGFAIAPGLHALVAIRLNEVSSKSTPLDKVQI